MSANRGGPRRTEQEASPNESTGHHVKGGIIGLVVGKAWSALVMLVLVAMLLVAVVGTSSTASIARSTAKIGGQATGLVFGSLPSFFSSIKDGQALTGGGDKAPAKPAAKK